MTWIVGTGTMFGHAILASDIRVTLKYSGGTERNIDCLQKVYPIGRFIVGGFAGSVRIGFSIIGHLQSELAKVEEGCVWDLDIISNTWLPRMVRRIFNSFPASEKDAKSQIMLAATHPRMNWPFPRMPLPVLYKFDSPEFKPQKAAPNEVLGIGYGATIDRMVEVNRICKMDFFNETIYGGKEYQAMYVANILEHAIKKTPLFGVSSLFQFATVNREQIYISNHESYLFTEEGKKPILKFPDELATNYEQFERIASKADTNKAYAIC